MSFGPKTGKAGSVHETLWPEYDPELEQEETLEISVQVNGKLRGVLQACTTGERGKYSGKGKNTGKRVTRFLQKGQIRKVIYIKGRTINFVVS